MPLGFGGPFWLALGVVLFFSTFGLVGLYGVLYLLFLIAGCLIIAYYHGKEVSRRALQIAQAMLAAYPDGIVKVMRTMVAATKFRNFDKRMTGASIIDDALKEIVDNMVRDYFRAWYCQVSDHEEFLMNIRLCVQKVIITFAGKSKEIDWMPYFTQRVVDDFASHIRLYRRTVEKIRKLPKEEREQADLSSMFFDLEVEMEDTMCRDLVCTSIEDERQYLQDLSEVLLFLLLTPEDFHNKAFRYIIREVLVNGMFLPTIELVSDPDYINQTIAWSCKEATFNNESFLTVIKQTDCIDELSAVKEKVELDIARWRSKDTGGNDDNLIKQNLNSLLFVKKICETRVQQIQEGIDETDFDADDDSDFLRAQNLFRLTLDDIINSNIALTYFIEFMTSAGAQQYLYFYLNVEGFRVAAEQQISEAYLLKKSDSSAPEPDLESLRRAALIIYDQYLSEKATSKLKIDSEIIKRNLKYIKQRMLSEDVFDEIQAKVCDILNSDQYYEAFLQSTAYVKLLAELGMLPDSKTEDGDTLDFDDDLSTISEALGDPANSPDNEDDVDTNFDDTSELEKLFSITAHITQTGIVKESDKSGKSYAVFAVTVKKQTGDDKEVWDVYRRYSDFHDMHMIIAEKFPDVHGLTLPGKTAFKNMNKEFLEKRRKALDTYLQNLMSPDTWGCHPGLGELVIQFLAPGLWEKHKSDLARKMDTIVNPLRQVGHTMKQVPDSVVDGVHKVKGLSDGLGRALSIKGLTANLSRSELLDSGKVGAGLDPEAAENIPLRIMLLLMDEVFDLRHKNQWLRRRLVAILRQLIKATFGDRINRKIVDQVDWLTSAEQMSEYIKNFRDSFWPQGILAEPRPPRDYNTKMRTRVACKAKLQGSCPDELKTLMGTETIKKGAYRVVDMFQQKTLNKRLVYVLLEGVVETLFPQNKFKETFQKLHSRSPRVLSRETAEAQKKVTLMRRKPEAKR